jgi:enoyl-CoA hydratase/carnithine racemase
LTGRLFKAEEALAGGLISEIVPPASLLDRAKEIAREIAEETAPVSIALTRQLLWRYAGAPDYSEVLKIDGPLAMELGAGGDVKEGVAAFLEKRKPRFSGRVSTDMPGVPWDAEDS